MSIIGVMKIIGYVTALLFTIVSVLFVYSCCVVSSISEKEREEEFKKEVNKIRDKT